MNAQPMVFRSLLLAALPAFVLLAPEARAVPSVWHVRTDGNDTLCSGKSNAPDPGTGAPPRDCAFETPQAAVDATGGGDTVLLHGGVYKTPGTPLLGRTTIFSLFDRDEFDSESDRLVVRDAGDGPVVFDGDDTLDTAVIIADTSFVTLQGIDIRNFTAGHPPAASWGAAAVKVESSSLLDPSAFVILRSLTIHDATLDHLTGQFAEIAADCDTCGALWIDLCTIDSNEPTAVVLGKPGAAFLSGVAVTGNRISHVRSNQAWTGLRAERTSLGVMSRNYFEDSAQAVSQSDMALLLDSQTWDVLENSFRRVGRSGLHVQDDFGDADTLEEHFVLNNLVDCGGGTTNDGIIFDGCTSCEGRNNLVVACGFGVLVELDNTGSEYGFNGFFQNSLNYGSNGGFGFSFIGSDVTGDPLFNATGARPDPFYRLLGGSPMIDSGSDAFCASAPPDTMCDIGPFQVSGPSSMAPSTPSLLFVDMITGKSAVLHGSTFSDPDASSTHRASQWQVDLAGGNFNSPVVDSGTTTQDKTSFKAGGLAALTSYQGRVRYQDDDQNFSPWSAPGPVFTTLVATAIPPKVVSVAPVSGAKLVPVTVSPVLTFNVPVDPASITTATISLIVNGSAVAQAAGSPMLDGTQTIVTIIPAVLLTPSSKYKISVAGGSSGVLSRDSGIAGKSFKATFKTESALVSSSPADGATGVSTGVTPSLTFSAPINPATATTASVTLVDAGSGGAVALSSVSVSGATITVTPVIPLNPGRKYRLDALAGASGVLFADGRQLGDKVRVTFKTS